MQGGSSAVAHVVVLPLPARGHVNPLLHMSRLLAARGVLITYVNTPFNAQSMRHYPAYSPSEAGRGIRFVEIPDGLPEGHGRAATDLVEFLQSAVWTMGAPFEQLLLDLFNDASSPAPTCVLADNWMVFAVEICKKLRLAHGNFWTQSAISFASLLMAARGHVLDCEVPGAPYLKPCEMNSFVQCNDPSDFMFQFITAGFDRLQESEWIFFNTFEELEHETISFLKVEFPAISVVGPLLPPSLLENRSDDDQNTLWVEEEECLGWLNTFPPGKVLYVAFGSLAVVSQQEVEEIALGLEASGHPFLWAARVDLMHGESAVFPEGFLSRVKDRAKVVSWVPQLKILGHPSIRAFFTHGGWNSTLESLAVGVPMLGWPYFSDQFMDCKCIEQGWKVGLRLLGDGDKLTRAMVEAKVKEVMENAALWEKAKEWSALARKAALEGGSSYTNLQSFVGSLKTLASPRT